MMPLEITKLLHSQKVLKAERSYSEKFTLQKATAKNTLIKPLLEERTLGLIDNVIPKPMISLCIRHKLMDCDRTLLFFDFSFAMIFFQIFTFNFV